MEFEEENLVLGSDLGQYAGPPHPEGLRMLLAALLGLGVPYEYLERMTKVNPARVLGLETGWVPAMPAEPSPAGPAVARATASGEEGP